MFFMYMQRSTDLEAYISSCKFWSCLFYILQCQHLLLLLIGICPNITKHHQKRLQNPPNLLLSNFSNVANPNSQLIPTRGCFFFHPFLVKIFPSGMTWNSPCAAWWTWSRLPALTEPLRWPGSPMPGWSLTAPSGGNGSSSEHGNCKKCYDSCIYCIFLCVHCL